MRRKSQKKKYQGKPTPAICPKCNKIVTTPPKVDPLYNAFRKWKCEHCATVWGENFQKASCRKFGIVLQSRCRVCSYGIVASAKGSNCPYFVRMLRPPQKWLLKVWEKS